MRHSITYALVIVFGIFSVQPVLAQSELKDDPKVGVVLSGGGAKGLAHIGVLKRLEDAGVRIDYIGGTSMGAIVGGLYASGYSASQLDSIFKTVDFDRLIQDDIPRNAKTFYEKNETDRYAITLPFEGFQLRLPSGISKGQNFYNLFSRLTSHVSDIENFAELPIPFFCVATNIETGEAVIMEEGYLPQAISASGALPSLFSPVIINDTVLVDGGVVNNYPVDEVRAKGMDIIIGVDVQDSLRTREKLRSGLEVLTQINNFKTINDMKAKRKKTDVYINPNIDAFTVVSFDKGEQIIDAGYKEAYQYSQQFFEIAARQKKSEKLNVNFDQESAIFIKEVEIHGNTNYTRSYVLGKLKLQVPDTISYTRFNQGVNNLSATGNFQDINYRFVEADDGSYKAVFQLRESDTKTLLRLGAHYDDLFRTGALINLTRKRLFTNNDIASFDFVVGDNIRYSFDYYIDKGYYWSVGFHSSFNFFDKDVPLSFVFPEGFEEEVSAAQLNKIELEYSDFTNQLYVETLFRRTFLLGMGVEHKRLRYLSETIGLDQDDNLRTLFENTDYYSTYGYLTYDTYDNTFFPKEGLFLSGDFHLYLFANGLNTDFESFSIAKAKAGYAHSFFGDFTAWVTTEGGFKIGDDTTRSFDFFVGGFGFKEINNIVPLYGYEALSLRGNTYLKSAVTFDYEFLRKNHVNLAANISNVGDDLFEDGAFIDRINYWGVALGYGLETFLGPLQIKYSYSPERGESEWYVSAGFKF
ncbi:MAG: patatin-like phospholipase family protein [Marinirhabdus sp.]|nr:patatin-like phospholipase family protein [Marinirhabdus sp.]